jgi:surface protein
MITLTANPSTGWRFVRWEGDWSSSVNPVNLGMTRDYNIVGIFEKRNYPLNITVVGSGEVQERVILQKTTEYPFQTVVELTAVPFDGWEFVDWAGDLSGSQSPVTITVDNQKSITARFTKKTYTVEVLTDGSGTVTKTPELEVYEHGSVITLTPVPAEFWSFSEWTGSVTGNVNPLEITVTSALSITGKFERRNYPLTITIQGNGEVNERVIHHKTTDYPYGTQVELTPVPSEGSRFVQWSGDLSGTQVPAIIIVSEPRSVTATFESSFSLAENGITITCPFARVGEKGFVDGVQYEAVDRNLLIQRVNQNADLTKVCTSLVTDMSGLFYDKTTFNQNISNWDVSNVVNMRDMFYGAAVFNQAIGVWDVGKVVIMENMFHNNYRSYLFNQNLNDWDVSNVKIMDRMFHGATNFNSPLDRWDVSSVVSMHAMFLYSGFNQPIGNWDVSNVTNMSALFYYSQFNQSIIDWNVSKVSNMESMFTNSPFNQPIGNWDVSSVTNMSNMLADSQFNQPIDDWDVSKVTNMYRMFLQSQFNQPIGNWDVGNVTNMTDMFYGSQFNQNISSWCVTKIGMEPNGFASGFLRREYKPVWGNCPVR